MQTFTDYCFLWTWICTVILQSFHCHLPYLHHPKQSKSHRERPASIESDQSATSDSDYGRFKRLVTLLLIQLLFLIRKHDLFVYSFLFSMSCEPWSMMNRHCEQWIYLMFMSSASGIAGWLRFETLSSIKVWVSGFARRLGRIKRQDWYKTFNDLASHGCCSESWERCCKIIIFYLSFNNCSPLDTWGVLAK